jgi:gas vesicle protein
VDEWIGNQDGSMRLMMRKEGDLVLMTSQLSKECKGTEVYQRPSTQLGYPELIRHMGYVDEDAILHEYPTELLTLGQNFQSFVQTDIPGQDLDENQPLTQISLEEMKQACLKQPDCGGFVYDPVNQQGWLKSKDMSSANFQFSDTMTTYMRIPAVSTESPDCRNMPLTAVDSNMYALFPKGSDMTSSTACGLAREIQPLRKQLKEISQQLNETAKQMKIQIDLVASRTEKNTGIFDQRTHTMALNLAKNAEIQQRIAQWHNDTHSGVEGFQSQSQQTQQTQQDVSAQFQDANLLVNKMSDNYYLWALGTFAIIGAGWWYFRKRREILNSP